MHIDFFTLCEFKNYWIHDLHSHVDVHYSIHYFFLGIIMFSTNIYFQNLNEHHIIQYKNSLQK